MTDSNLEALHAQMTLEEKVALLNGRHLWKTAMNFRLNIPELVMTDGTHGVRYSPSQVEGVTDERDSLAQFMEVVNQTNDADAMLGDSVPATCFPNGSAFACSWDMDLAREFGAALARECRSLGVHLLLGPGINIRRTPLQGRSYEYYSEDPVLSGDLAAALITGLQDNGVGASLKHFACNNSEIERTTMSSEVSERALREIYLKGFERAIAGGRPWTVMSAYNRINGVQAAEHRWLLTDVLRGEWGYEGVVVSDWHGIKDRAASMSAGNDLDMPESSVRRAELLQAIAEGRVDMVDVDASCMRMLRLVRQARAGEDRGARYDAPAHHELARRIAAQSLVLLKNRKSLLPLDPARHKRLLVVGAGAINPIIQGSGSATTHPTARDIPLDEIRAIAGPDVSIVHREATDPAGFAQMLDEARAADAVIVFANSEISGDGERADRRNLELEPGQAEAIAALAGANANCVIVLAAPDAVVMPWEPEVGAILMTFYAGQGMGHAVARTLFGAANPGGKLTTTFPRRVEDVPGWLSYPGENGRHDYGEGIFVGYRGYDARAIEPLYPFGFGLSYTSFAYDGLALDRQSLGMDDVLAVSLSVINTGPCDGAETVQLYARPNGSRLRRPPRELKGFAKVFLRKGETRRITIPVSGRDLAYYDPALGKWQLDDGTTTIEVGASSRDIRLAASLVTVPDPAPPPRFDIDTQPAVLFDWPGVREALAAFLADRLGIGVVAADALLDRCSTSFLGIHKTICWFIGDRLPPEELRSFLDQLSTMDVAVAADAAGATRH
ncbi:glycoside hydrolase family 3 C-terminal domain-containing protein [Sphingobium sp. H39-3-25]|uniref:beta-glucosidase family protein n=1 Tax=Sphingobium arseniciresistens TaxID=3030834 RepID=UPI0023B9E1E1|nr:glycoside hydrolase family 3 C-terminal domain-containing protein [Sphingobium arseniciresistens]